MKFTVYFEIFGKKLKHTIEAASKEDAKYKIMGKIKWHKIEKESNEVDDLLNIFGMSR